MAVIASFRTNDACPKDDGLWAPVLVVGVITPSWSFVSLAVRSKAAFPLVLAPRSTRGTRNARRGWIMRDSYLPGKMMMSV